MLIGLLSKPRLDRSPGWLHILQRLPTLRSYDASHSAERSAMPIFYQIKIMQYIFVQII